MANPANPTSTRALEGAGGSSDSSDGKLGNPAKVGLKVVNGIVGLVFVAWVIDGMQIPGLEWIPPGFHHRYVITGSSGISDGGNLDGTYSLVDKPCGADARLLRADCDAGTCGDVTCHVRTGACVWSSRFRDSHTGARVTDAPVYQRGAGAEGLVLYSTYVDCSGQGAADNCSWPSVWYVYGCSTPSRTAAATGNGYGYKYAMRYSTPGQPPGAPDDDAAYGAWGEVQTGSYDQVDTPLAIHRTEDGDGCPNIPLAGMLVFVYLGVHWTSAWLVGAWLPSQRNQLHREHGAEAEARCIKSWTNSESDGMWGESQSFHMTLIYCVPMPQPTAEAQYLKITKDVQVTNKSYWKQEGEMVPINHLLKYTGDARNIDMVIAAETSSMERSICEVICGCWTISTAVLVYGMPLSVIAGAGCGVKLIWLLLIVIGVPILYKVSAEKNMEKERGNPDGTLEEVDEQGKEMAMTTGSQTELSKREANLIRRFGCSSEVATDALKRFGGHAGQAGLWLQEQRQQQDEQGQGQQQVTGEVLNPTATAVLQATAVPIAEATGDPEIASQDSAAAGYALPPPPGTQDRNYD